MKEDATPRADIDTAVRLNLVLRYPCKRCGSVLENHGGKTPVCPCDPGDEFDQEARRLLTDDGSRSWAEVESDVAAALRAASGRK